MIETGKWNLVKKLAKVSVVTMLHFILNFNKSLNKMWTHVISYIVLCIHLYAIDTLPFPDKYSDKYI